MARGLAIFYTCRCVLELRKQPIQGSTRGQARAAQNLGKCAGYGPGHFQKRAGFGAQLTHRRQARVAACGGRRPAAGRACSHMLLCKCAHARTCQAAVGGCAAGMCAGCRPAPADGSGRRAGEWESDSLRPPPSRGLARPLGLRIRGAWRALSVHPLRAKPRACRVLGRPPCVLPRARRACASLAFVWLAPHRGSCSSGQGEWRKGGGVGRQAVRRRRLVASERVQSQQRALRARARVRQRPWRAWHSPPPLPSSTAPRRRRRHPWGRLPAGTHGAAAGIRRDT